MNFVRCLEHTCWPSFRKFCVQGSCSVSMLYFISFWWRFCEILNCFTQMHDSKSLEGGSSVLEGKGSGHFPAKITHETVMGFRLVEILWTESTSVYGVRLKQMSGALLLSPGTSELPLSHCARTWRECEDAPSPLNWESIVSRLDTF